MRQQLPASLTCRHAALVLAAALAFCLLAGCSSSQRVDLALDGSGAARVEIRLSPVLASYLRDLTATVTGVEPAANSPLFDIGSLREAFARYPGITLVDASTPRPDMLLLSVKFANAGSLLSRDGAGPEEFVTFTNRDGLRTLSIRLDRAVVAELLRLTPLAGSAAGSVLLPPAGTQMSPEEYTSYLAWALESYASENDVKKAIRGSRVDVTVTVAGSILNAEGGSVSGRSAAFSVPVVKLLTLQSPLVYALTFR